jgi:hypothetical protein
MAFPITKVSYRVSPSDEEIELIGIRDFGGGRVNVTLRRAIAGDLDMMESLEKKVGRGEMTSREMDDRILAMLITKWGDAGHLPTSLQLESLHLEARAALLMVFRGFCIPSVELVEENAPG